MFFRVVSFNGPQHFTTGSLYTSIYMFFIANTTYKKVSIQYFHNKNVMAFLLTVHCLNDDILQINELRVPGCKKFSEWLSGCYAIPCLSSRVDSGISIQG